MPRLSDASPVQSRGLAYVDGDRVAQLSAAPAGADVTYPRVHVDLVQADKRPAGDRRLGIGGLDPRLQGELFGGTRARRSWISSKCACNAGVCLTIASNVVTT